MSLLRRLQVTPTNAADRHQTHPTTTTEAEPNYGDIGTTENRAQHHSSKNVLDVLPLAVESIRVLQRTYGNRAVQRMIKNQSIKNLENTNLKTRISTVSGQKPLSSLLQRELTGKHEEKDYPIRELIGLRKLIPGEKLHDPKKEETYTFLKAIDDEEILIQNEKGRKYYYRLLINVYQPFDEINAIEQALLALVPPKPILQPPLPPSQPMSALPTQLPLSSFMESLPHRQKKKKEEKEGLKELTSKEEWSDTDVLQLDEETIGSLLDDYEFGQNMSMGLVTPENLEAKLQARLLSLRMLPNIPKNPSNYLLAQLYEMWKSGGTAAIESPEILGVLKVVSVPQDNAQLTQEIIKDIFAKIKKTSISSSTGEDECEYRAHAMCELIHEAYPAIAKKYLTKEWIASKNDTKCLHGNAWKHHVAPRILVGGSPMIIDPLCSPDAPIQLEDWHLWVDSAYKAKANVKEASWESFSMPAMTDKANAADPLAAGLASAISEHELVGKYKQ